MRRYIFVITLLFGIASTGVLQAQQSGKGHTVITEDMSSPELSVENNIIHVRNATVGSKLKIVTVVGTTIQEIELQTKNSSYELNLPKAIYIFKLDGVVRKFIISSKSSE
ncbi:hypothetical protein FACS1894162_5190 [Bacteroidia bacterium]|nr:hypothetical protein FACS1894162_5190 [Bacteroidia bacterium]